jgi:serine protease Do
MPVPVTGRGEFAPGVPERARQCEVFPADNVSIPTTRAGVLTEIHDLQEECTLRMDPRRTACLPTVGSRGYCVWDEVSGYDTARISGGNLMLVHSMGMSISLRLVRLLAATLLSGIAGICSQSQPAQAADPADPQETTARKITPTSFDALPPAAVLLPSLPLAFTKGVPESIDDLREMEAHVHSLVAKLTETTVGLTIGNAQGSGVIVSEDGMVLTAAHVSGPPGRPVTVLLSDGTRAFGRSLGRNRRLDASLIKIETPEKKWSHAPIASLKDITVGDWSIVMGHPGGHQAGRLPVFRLGRVIEADDQVIQTDNELVGGDSGGPLFDMHGRVIGINSRIGPETSLNLHAPICAYTDDWDRLCAGEDIILHSGAVLGVSAEPVEQGVRVTRVWPGDPADRAGLREGDILLRFDSRRVPSFERLRELVGKRQPGTRVVLSLLRGDEVLEISVELGERQRTAEE